MTHAAVAYANTFTLLHANHPDPEYSVANPDAEYSVVTYPEKLVLVRLALELGLSEQRYAEYAGEGRDSAAGWFEEMLCFRTSGTFFRQNGSQLEDVLSARRGRRRS